MQVGDLICFCFVCFFLPAIYCSIGSKQISSTIINDGNAADEQCDVSADSAGRRRRRRRKVGTRWLAPSQTLSIRDLDVVRQSLGEANQRRFPLDGSSPWQPRPETRTHHRKKKNGTTSKDGLKVCRRSTHTRFHLLRKQKKIGYQFDADSIKSRNLLT